MTCFGDYRRKETPGRRYEHATQVCGFGDDSESQWPASHWRGLAMGLAGLRAGLRIGHIFHAASKAIARNPGVQHSIRAFALVGVAVQSLPFPGWREGRRGAVSSEG